VPAQKKVGDDQAIGRSRGGLSTKIHALVDALDNVVGFFLTGGQAHDLVGADHLLPEMEAGTLIADKAFDADERVIAPRAAAGKKTVIPPKANRKSPPRYDRNIYKERHLIENFSRHSSGIAPSRHVTIKPRTTFWRPFISRPLSIG
jgi:transposase